MSDEKPTLMTLGCTGLSAFVLTVVGLVAVTTYALATSANRNGGHGPVIPLPVAFGGGVAAVLIIFVLRRRSGPWPTGGAVAVGVVAAIIAVGACLMTMGGPPRG